MKTFEEIKNCLVKICDEHPELDNYKQQIIDSIKEQDLEKIRLEMLTGDSTSKEKIAQKINICSNEFSEDNQYGK